MVNKSKQILYSKANLHRLIQNFFYSESNFLKYLPNKTKTIISNLFNNKSNYVNVMQTTHNKINYSRRINSTKYQNCFLLKCLVNKNPHFNFSSKLNRNDYLNFERNNIIKDNEIKSKKTKLKNHNEEFMNETGKGKLNLEEKGFYLVFLALNAPLVVSSLYFGVFNLNWEHFNQMSRIILNMQLLNNFFFSGILVSGIFKSVMNQYLGKVNILTLMEAKDNEENLELEKIRKSFLMKVLLCITPGLFNFYATHILLNKAVLNFDLLLTGGSSIALCHLMLFLLFKFFKIEKQLGFSTNWNVIIGLNLISLLLFFYVINKRMKGKLNEKGDIVGNDAQPFKVKNDTNRLENFKKYEQFLKDEELKFTDDNQDIFNAIYNEIDNIKDLEKQKAMIRKLEIIFDEN